MPSCADAKLWPGRMHRVFMALGPVAAPGQSMLGSDIGNVLRQISLRTVKGVFRRVDVDRIAVGVLGRTAAPALDTRAEAADRSERCCGREKIRDAYLRVFQSTCCTSTERMRACLVAPAPCVPLGYACASVCADARVQRNPLEKSLLSHSDPGSQREPRHKTLCDFH
jgi:hypothetical protein